MEISSLDKVEKQAGPDTRFAGTVEREPLASERDGLPGAAAVTFRDGARTHWHSHAGGQLLFVVEGEGRVGTGTEVVTIRPGDLVVAPPGEWHWHGAAEGHDMTHLAISAGESSWGDPVS